MDIQTALRDVERKINEVEAKKVSVYVGKKKKKPEDEFVLFFIKNVQELLKDITMTDLSVLLAYGSNMVFGNQINISQQRIANQLNLDQPRVSRAVKKLIKLNVFIQTEDGSMYMNWHYLAKGNWSDFEEFERTVGTKIRVPENARGFCQKRKKEI